MGDARMFFLGEVTGIALAVAVFVLGRWLRSRGETDDRGAWWLHSCRLKGFDLVTDRRRVPRPCRCGAVPPRRADG